MQTRVLAGVAMAAGLAACGRIGFDGATSSPTDGPDATDGGVTTGCTASPPTTGPIVYADPIAGDDAADGSIDRPVRTVMAALALLPAGGTVIARSGRYTEVGNQIVVSSQVPIRITSAERYAASLPGLMCRDCSLLTVDGFEVTGPTIGLHVNGGSSVTLADNIVHDTTSAGIRVSADPTAVTIVDNVVYDAGSYGIHVNGASAVRIEGNVVFDTVDHPTSDAPLLWIEDAIAPIVARNIAVHALRRDTTYGLVSLRTPTAAVFENNVFGASPAPASIDAIVGFDSAVGSAIFRHNTFIGPMAGAAFGLSMRTLGGGSDFQFGSNVWATALAVSSPFSVSDAPPGTVTLRHNLYFARGAAFSDGGSPDPTFDVTAVLADPQLPLVTITPPTWTPLTRQFSDGTGTTCSLHDSLAVTLATIPATSPAAGAGADVDHVSVDIRGQARPPAAASLGAFEP